MRLLLIAMLLVACSKSEAPPVHGWIVRGSISTEIVDERSIYTFTVAKDGQETRARLVGPPPDAFKDGAEVTLRGTMRDGVLEVAELRAIVRLPDGTEVNR